MSRGFFESLELIVRGIVVDMDDVELKAYLEVKNGKYNCTFTYCDPSNIVQQLKLDGLEPHVSQGADGMYCVSLNDE